ncbi:MAG: iron-sulfur cluster assembly scaffold protein [Chloroflexi bacterium]|nr:iron-sulfur cluster assembly scaffold protein [Chloroflexota bacterium]OQB02171.1 MAG: NifU-like protein [Chloroflexi bacterium ADurb.Bin222]HOC20504.1 iron-sulfur cluster assembly scaffold protein [Anaerolineae bacterium]HOS79857.1 iron-sulfur cluster assembly scaffold protein [Anaerolineae bacterium]HOV48378.1 iron-sulfur cluster assembly scaffold protein [Anaerolineae bacterium]
MSDLYREQLLEHYHEPQNYGVLPEADVDVQLDNPTCGDTIHLTARLDPEGRIAKVMFEGHGCVISMAAASMLTEDVVGKTPQEVAALELHDVEEMMGGLRLSMGRVKCALLAVNALKKGLRESGRL